jgi:hypothetical protein
MLHALIEDAVGRLLANEQTLVDALPPDQQAKLADTPAVLLDSLTSGAATRPP